MNHNSSSEVTNDININQSLFFTPQSARVVRLENSLKLMENQYKDEKKALLDILDTNNRMQMMNMNGDNYYPQLNPYNPYNNYNMQNQYNPYDPYGQSSFPMMPLNYIMMPPQNPTQNPIPGAFQSMAQGYNGYNSSQNYNTNNMNGLNNNYSNTSPNINLNQSNGGNNDNLKNYMFNTFNKKTGEPQINGIDSKYKNKQ